MANHFVNNLLALAKERGVSMNAVGRETGIPASTIMRLVKRGEDAAPADSTVKKIASYFDYPSEAFMNEALREPVQLASVVRKYEKKNEGGLFDELPEFENKTQERAPGNTRPHSLKGQNMLGELVPIDEVAERLQNIGLDGFTKPTGRLRIVMPCPPGLYVFGFVAFEMETSAMEPTIKSGSYVIATSTFEPDFNDCEIYPRKIKNGQIVVTKLEGDSTVRVRRYLRGENGVGWLTCDNPKFPEVSIQIQEKEILGIVIGTYEYL